MPTQVRDAFRVLPWGNWTNNGTFLPSTTGSDVGVIFDANGPMQPQIISGTATETFYKLTINGTQQILFR